MPRLLTNTTNAPATSQTPVNAILDDFTRADSTTTLGANWTVNTQVGANGGKDGISSNQLYNPWGSFSNYTSYYWNPNSFNANQEVYLTISTLGSYNANDNPAVFARITSPGASYSGYGFTYYDSNGGCFITKITAGTAVQIGSTGSYSPASGDKLRLEIVGTTLRGYTFHAGTWTLRVTVTDTTFQAGGSIGVYIPGNTQDGRFDDFGGGNLADIVVPNRSAAGIRSAAGTRTAVT